MCSILCVVWKVAYSNYLDDSFLMTESVGRGEGYCEIFNSYDFYFGKMFN